MWLGGGRQAVTCADAAHVDGDEPDLFRWRWAGRRRARGFPGLRRGGGQCPTTRGGELENCEEMMVALLVCA